VDEADLVLSFGTFHTSFCLLLSCDDGHENSGL
jgi:hypothetical protein